MTNSSPQKMHEIYCRITGLYIPWSMDRLWPWECFCLRFTEEDLRTVIGFIKGQEKAHRPARSLTFRNFIASPDSLAFFEEDLAQAKSLLRQKQTPRDKLLTSIGRPPPTKEAKQVGDILAGEKALQDLLKLRSEL